MEYKEIIESFNEYLNEDKKKRKKQCIKGQGNHSAKDGRFVNPYKEKGSFSIGKGNTSGKDCDWGKASRKQANRSHQFVKQPCGRNSKYRCKDGSAKWEESIDVNEDFVMGPSGEVMAPDLRNVSEGDLINEISRRIDEGRMSNDQILGLCSKIAQASKGDFPPRK